MNVNSLPAGWTDDACWLVQAADPVARLARLVHMTSDHYRCASFLDDRMMADKPESRLCHLDDVLAAGRAQGCDEAGWIFHIGHVGSTLFSRLLGDVEGSFAIREPRSLRDLMAFSDAERPAAASAIARLMSRRLPDGAWPIIKATSFVSEYAPLLLSPDSRAVFLYATPRNYIASILAGPNSVKELRTLEPVRRNRLAARGICLNRPKHDDAHRAAEAWLTEMASLEAAAGIGEGVIWFDFDQMLDGMVDALSISAQHFGLTMAPDRLAAIVDGPLMKRYSKAMEYEYSPRLRHDLLAEANLRYGSEIDRAMDWLTQAAAQHQVLAAALARAE